MLRRKQAQYEEGVSRASSARNMIRNAPLTDFANIELRDKYLKDADDALKKISSADFSLPQNVDSAMNIYSPFWEDSTLLTDMQKTKIHNNSIAELSSWKNSKDEKIRSQYSDIAYQYIMNDVEKLRNANRDPEKYKDVEGRPAVPFANVERYLDDEAAKEPDKLKIVWDEADGPALYRIENGERSLKNFKVWAQSKIGNNFVGQFRVTGIVKTENDKKEVRRMHPEYTEQQVSETIAKKHVNHLKQGHENRLKEVDLELARITDLVDKIPATFDRDKLPGYKRLVDQKDQLVQYKEQLRMKYDQFDQTSQDRIYKSVLESPEKYYATMAEQMVVDNWSVGRASIASRKIEKNDPYIEMLNIQNERIKLQNEAVKNQIDAMTAASGKITKTTTTSVTKAKDENLDGIDDETGLKIEGYDQDTGGRYLGKTTTDIYKNLPSAWDRFTKIQQDTYNSANDLIFDPSGVLNLAKKGLGLNERDVTHVSTAYKRYMNGRGNLYKNPDIKDNEETVALDKFHNALYTDAGVVDGMKSKSFNKNANLGVEALLKYVENTLIKRSQLTKEGTEIPFNDEENKSLMGYIIAKNMLNTYWANENSRKQLIQDNIVNDPKFAKLVVNRNGNKDMVAINDLTKLLGVTQIKAYGKGDIETTLTAEDIAIAYMNGDVSDYIPTTNEMLANRSPNSPLSSGEYFIGKTIIKDGQKYSIVQSKNVYVEELKRERGIPASNTIVDKFMLGMDNINSRFGSSKDFAKEIQAANERVVPNLLFYQKQSGNIGSTFGYNFNQKVLGDPATVIFLEALQPGNVKNIMYDDGLNNSIPVPAAEQAVIRNLLKDENNIEKYVGGFEYNTIDVNGKPTISFSLNAVDNDVKIGNKTLDQMSGLRIKVELSPAAEGPMMKGLPNPTGQYIFSSIIRGERISADPIMKAAGFDFDIDPDNTEDPRTVKVSGKYFKRVIIDEKTGELINNLVETPFEARYNLKGENAKSPDQIMNFVMSLFNSALQFNNDKQKEYDKFTKTQSQQSSTSSQMITPGARTPVVSNQASRAELFDR
jgi:hypothetical protein